MSCPKCGNQLAPGQNLCASCQDAVALDMQAAAAREDVESLYTRAWAARQAGSFAEASRISKQIIALAPEWSEGYVLLAEVHADQRQYREAMLCYRKAIQLTPDAPALQERYNVLIELSCLLPPTATASPTPTPAPTSSEPEQPVVRQTVAPPPASRRYAGLFVGLLVILALLAFAQFKNYLGHRTQLPKKSPTVHSAPDASGPGAQPANGNADSGGAANITPPPPDPVAQISEPPVAPPGNGGAAPANPPEPSLVSVPACKGRTLQEAQELLARKGLQCSTQAESTTGAAAGTVLSSTPAAGNKVAPGTLVVLTVAEPPLIPDVSRMTPENAKTVLKEKGLIVVGVDGNSGRVRETKPPAGMPYPADRRVTLCLEQ